MVDVVSDQFAQNLILDLIPTRKDNIGHSYADTRVGKIICMQWTLYIFLFGFHAGD